MSGGKGRGKRPWRERHRMPSQALFSTIEGGGAALLWCKPDGILRETHYPYTVRLPGGERFITCRSQKFARLLARSILNAEYLRKVKP